MRAYNARAVALALDTPIKWVDNLLSHYRLPGVSHTRQGVERKITDQGFLAITAVRMLTSDLGIPLGRAATLASAAVETKTTSQMSVLTESGITVAFPIAELERDLRQRMIAAVEGIARIPRGRPARRAATSMSD